MRRYSSAIRKISAGNSAIWTLSNMALVFSLPASVELTHSMPDKLSSSWGKAASVCYIYGAAVGDIVGTSTEAGVVFKSGFIGQVTAFVQTVVYLRMISSTEETDLKRLRPKRRMCSDSEHLTFHTRNSRVGSLCFPSSRRHLSALLN